MVPQMVIGRVLFVSLVRAERRGMSHPRGEFEIKWRQGSLGSCRLKLDVEAAGEVGDAGG